MHKVKSHRSVEQIAKKHRMEVSFIKNQLEMGIPIEHEHTKDKDLATDIALQHLDEIPDYYTRLKKMEASAKKEHKKFKDTPVSEGTLTHWFKGSQSNKGKPGWVQPDGSPCANEPGETKTPKCFSSARLASLKSKGEEGESIIKSAVRRKRAKDKDQQAKSGAAAPTNVPTFAKGKKDPNYVKAEPGIKEEMELKEARKDKPGKGSGKKDACYSKVKSRYDVWPSAYASGALVKCRKVGAGNWGNKSESLNYDWDTPIRERADRYCPKCEKLELRSECKYGPKYWDMFSLPAELISSKKDFNTTMPHPGNMPEGYDHEHSMARSELSTIVSAAKRLRGKLKGEGNIEAWVQSKITKAADYLDAAADYVDSGEMKEENVSIQDIDGNNYVDFIDIIKPEPLKASRGIGSRILGEGPSFEVGDKKLSSAQEKLHKMSPSQRSQLPSQMVKKLVGADLPPLKASPGSMAKLADSYNPNLKTFSQFVTEAKKSEMKCNSPKSEPVGDSLTGKSHVVKACEGGKEKLIRFGQRGVKGSPKKDGESKAYASRRNRFQTRHAKNIAKGKMSAAFWANKVKW